MADVGTRWSTMEHDGHYGVTMEAMANEGVFDTTHCPFFFRANRQPSEVKDQLTTSAPAFCIPASVSGCNNWPTRAVCHDRRKRRLERQTNKFVVPKNFSKLKDWPRNHPHENSSLLVLWECTPAIGPLAVHKGASRGTKWSWLVFLSPVVLKNTVGVEGVPQCDSGCFATSSLYRKTQTASAFRRLKHVCFSTNERSVLKKN